MIFLPVGIKSGFYVTGNFLSYLGAFHSLIQPWRSESCFLQRWLWLHSWTLRIKNITSSYWVIAAFIQGLWWWVGCAFSPSCWDGEASCRFWKKRDRDLGLIPKVLFVNWFWVWGRYSMRKIVIFMAPNKPCLLAYMLLYSLLDLGEPHTQGILTNDRFIHNLL